MMVHNGLFTASISATTTYSVLLSHNICDLIISSKIACERDVGKRPYKLDVLQVSQPRHLRWLALEQTQLSAYQGAGGASDAVETTENLNR